MSNTPAAASHWSDDPQSADDRDLLGRESFVATVVKRIQVATASDSSTVFGLVGGWGSGKSSVLARVRHGLEEDWILADFTPWSSGDVTAMSLEFVSTLSSALGKKQAGKLRSNLAGYAKAVTPALSMIPLAGAAANGVVDKGLELIAVAPPWHAQFEKLSKSITELGRRVLIIVDDVDRLGGDELLNLLRIIRLLGRFRGVHYLIAYDQDTVEDLLRATGAVGRSSAFMEKIVQYPFEVPPVPRATAQRLLNEVLNELLRKAGIRLKDLDLYRASVLVGICAPRIRTPRTLGRFREHLLAFAHHVNEAELDLLDYVAITWLRLSAHGVWTELEAWQRELRIGERSTSLTTSEKITFEEWAERVATADPSAHGESTVSVLSFLFPGVGGLGESHHYEHSRAVSDPSYFGRYLLLALPENDVSDDLIQNVVAALVAGADSPREVELSRVVDGSDEALASLAIERIIKLRTGAQTTSLEFLTYLARRLNEPRDGPGGVGDPKNDLRRLVAHEIAVAVVSGAIEPAYVVSLLGEDEFFRLIWLVTRHPHFRDRSEEIMEGFARYWFEELGSRFDELRSRGLMRPAIKVVTKTIDPARLREKLALDVSDYEALLSLAEEFVGFNEWHGHDVSYEMYFDWRGLLAVAGVGVVAKFANQIETEARNVPYDNHDLNSVDVSPQVKRAFTVDSLAAVMRENARESDPDS